MPNPPRVPCRVPAGHYSTPDPDDPAVMTHWLVRATGQLSAFPAGHRWAPMPPGSLGPAARQAWYDEVYFGWVREVAATIERDPEQSADWFRATWGERPVPVERRPRRVAHHRTAGRMVDDILAALGARASSINAVARDTGHAWDTARKSVNRGRDLLDRDPDRARRLVLLLLRQALQEVAPGEEVEQVIDSLFAGTGGDIGHRLHRTADLS